MTQSRHNARYAKLRRLVGKVDCYIRKITFAQYWDCRRITFSQFEVVPDAFPFIVEEIRRVRTAWNNCIDLLVSNAWVNRFGDITNIPNSRHTHTFSSNERSANRLNPLLCKMSFCLKNVLPMLQFLGSHKLNIPIPQCWIRRVGSFACNDSPQLSKSVFCKFHETVL